MTVKERERLVIGNEKLDFNVVCKKDIEVGKILVKEIAKSLQKKGYDVSKNDFEVVKENGYPTRIEFKDHNIIVSKFSYLTTDAADKWINNSESLLKSLKASKMEARDDRYSGNGRTFKEFLKEVKVHCMRENRYNIDNAVEKDTDENER
jgi:signal recognition particle subunit SEC65